MRNYRTLVSAPDLAAALLAAPAAADTGQPNACVVLDCRAALSDPLAGRRSFDEGHIAGAQHADLEQHLARIGGDGATSRPGGRHPLPDAETLAKQCGVWGINETTQVVLYDAHGGAFAARGWWLLRWLGHENVAVLDGGLAHWPEPLTRQTADPTPQSFAIRPSLTRQASLTEVAAISDTSTPLLDARSIPRFEGREEPIDPVAGHIPHARCLPHTGNLDETGRFLSPAALRVRFANLAHEATICYCGSGVTATHNILAIRHAGLPEPRLYPGSFSEWIRDPARPIAR